MKRLSGKTKSQMTCIVLVGVMTLLMSCGQKDPGADIAIAVSPDKANIVPGKGNSCLALATAKKDDALPIPDVEGERVGFSRFVLQWKSSKKLTIVGIKATIFSTGINGADTPEGLELEIDEGELVALLGLTNLTIDFATFKADGTPVDPDYAVTVDSTDTVQVKTATNPYVACGIQLGGLAPKEGVKSYSARIKFELTAFETACSVRVSDAGVVTCKDGEQAPVRKSVTVRAERF